MKRDYSFFHWILGMILAMALIYMPIQYVSSLHQERMLEASIFEETNWQYYSYQYLGSGTQYGTGNPKFYLAHNGAGYFIVHVAQDHRTVEQITPLKSDREAIVAVVERYRISQ